MHDVEFDVGNTLVDYSQLVSRGIGDIDNAPGHTPPNPSLTEPKITIPVLSVSFEDGQKVKAALLAASEAEPVSAPALS